MADIQLFNGTVVTTLLDTDLFATGTPTDPGSKNISWSSLKSLISTINWTFSSNISVPTGTSGTHAINYTQFASALNLKANVNSPTFTGTVVVPVAQTSTAPVQLSQAQDASTITTGSLNNARLDPDIAFQSATNDFSGINVVSNQMTFSHPPTLTNGYYSAPKRLFSIFQTNAMGTDWVVANTNDDGGTLIKITLTIQDVANSPYPSTTFEIIFDKFNTTFTIPWQVGSITLGLGTVMLNPDIVIYYNGTSGEVYFSDRGNTDFGLAVAKVEYLAYIP